MSWYSIALFLHIVGALGLFAGIGLEQASLRGLRRARTTAALREWLTVMSARKHVEGSAALVLLATGIYMTATRWGGRAWIGLALLGLVAVGLMGAMGTGRTVRALAAELPAGDGPVPSALRQRIDASAMRTTAALRAALALGVVFDMTVKPAALDAALVLGVALVVGALAPRMGGRGALAAREYGAEH